MWRLLLLRASLLLLLFSIAFEYVNADSHGQGEGKNVSLSPPSTPVTRVVNGTNATRSASAGNAYSRHAFKKDLMVVLPVMQGNSDLSSSNLQMLYTKAPVTAIIGGGGGGGGGEGSKRLKLVEEPSATTAASLLVEKRIDSAAASFEGSFGKRDEPFASASRLVHKSHKSPLDYGYPESFKFVQELNELPKNHKPEWAQTEAVERDADASTSQSLADTTGATKRDPFQMFESVKPLEINKLLSLKGGQIPVASSPVSNDLFEETTTTRATPAPTRKKFQPQNTVSPPPNRLVKRPITKRPQLSSSSSSSKKPIKNKIAQSTKVMENDADTFPATASNSVESSFDNRVATGAAKVTAGQDDNEDGRPTEVTSTVSSTELDPELYAAARYTKLLAETTKVFLPTPYTFSSERGTTTNVKRLQTKWPTTKLTADDVTSSTSLRPNFKWSNASSVNNSSLNNASSGQINPSDLVSLTKILGERLNTPLSSSSPPPLPKPLPPPNETFRPAADVLTGDMKNMLIALGIIESESHPTSATPLSSSSSTTTSANTDSFMKNVFAKPQQQQLVTPTIDPNSYVNFKKIPIDFEKPKDRGVALSDDMRDLLASFGLLPGNGESGRTRVSRQRGSRWLPPQRNATMADAGAPSNGTRTAMANDTHAAIHSLPDEMRRTLENLGLLEAAALMYARHSPSSRSGHVFQPTIRLEEFGGDERKVKKINDAIETIRNLSKVEDVENLSVEEVQKKLETITSLLREENVVANNVSTPNTTTPLITSSTASTTEIFEISSTASTTTTTTTKKKSSSSAAVTTPTTSSTVSESSYQDDAFSIDIDNDSTLENLTSTSVSKNPTTTPSTDEVAGSASSSDKVESESVISSTKLSNSSDNENELKLIMNPPNPLSPEELQHLLEFNQNDVVQKRQQPNDTSTISTTELASSSSSPASSSSTSPRSDADKESTASSPTTTPPTVQPNNAPLPDLAASFGGGDDESSANSDETATPKPNGLYFYLDWNTFLNVGEADKNPIRIRFAPRAGNPRNFLPITVP